jgi:hypothetical protein
LAGVYTASDPGHGFFLGYILLIAISIAAARNPRLAAVAGVLYAVLMGFWMGSISRLYETYYDGSWSGALASSRRPRGARAVFVAGGAGDGQVREDRVATAGSRPVPRRVAFSIFGGPAVLDAAERGRIAISGLICLLAAANLSSTSR